MAGCYWTIQRGVRRIGYEIRELWPSFFRRFLTMDKGVFRRFSWTPLLEDGEIDFYFIGMDKLFIMIFYRRYVREIAISMTWRSIFIN